MQSTNPSKLHFCYLKIDSVRNKFTYFQEVINGNVDVASSAQFVLEGYHSSYRLDVSSESGGILLYVRSSIPSRHLFCENLCGSIQVVPFEINLRKEKWLVISVSRDISSSQNREYFLNNLTNMTDIFADT